MKEKIIQFIPAVLVLAVVGFRYFSPWCIDTITLCYGTWVHWIFLSVTRPSFIFFLPLLPIALILACVPRSVFISWLKFAVWAIPLLFIFISTQPVYAGFLSTDRDDAARLAGEVFAGVSLCIIIWRSIVTHRSIKQ